MDLNDFHIRTAALSDLHDIAVLEEDSFERPYPRFLFEMFLREHPETFWVATDASKKIVGYCIALLREKSAHLISIAVPRKLRGKGVGSALLQNLVQYLEGRRVEDVWLEVKPANKEAISLYTRLGFEKVVLLPNYYEDGSPALRMRMNFQKAVPEKE